MKIKGKPIKNPLAWVKQTAYNRIRELNREQRNKVFLEEETLAEECEPPSESTRKNEWATIKLAFQKLCLEDKRLIELKDIEKKSWQEIRVILREEGWGDCSETVLRKRKSRALGRLRSFYYDSIQPHADPPNLS